MGSEENGENGVKSTIDPCRIKDRTGRFFKIQQLKRQKSPNNGIQLALSTAAILRRPQQIQPSLPLPIWSANLLGAADTGRYV